MKLIITLSIFFQFNMKKSLLRINSFFSVSKLPRHYYKNGGERSIPRGQPNQNKEMKIADSVLLNRFMRDNENCNISQAPSTGLSSIQLSILNVLESLIPKDQKNITKYNNTEMKQERLFTAATQHIFFGKIK